MKFGEELKDNIFPPWRLEYLAYDTIKYDLKARQMDHSWNTEDEAHFLRTLEFELTKVDDFVSRKLREIDSRISYCERILNNAQAPSIFDAMDDTVTEILFDVNDLTKFTRYNYLGFQKLLKKHDKYTGGNMRQQFVPKFQAKPLDKQRFDIVIVRISALHDLCQLKGEARTGNAAAGGDQIAFERATAKYWIHPDNITEVKAIILFHLPVLVFNQDKPYEASDSAISSVYFDNEDYDLYTGRLQRDEGAEAIRFRWYGPVESPNIFIERKTHHAAWLDGASVKDRFRLKEHQVNNFVSGNYSADQIAEDLRRKGDMDENAVAEAHFIAQGIQTSFREKHLDPTLRVFYNRTAFQIPGDQRLRLSLDTDLTFIREDNRDGNQRRDPNSWRREDLGIDYPFSYVTPQDILRFPYAVLETKLQTHLGQEPPEWLTKLLDSSLVHEVPRFSKYLHGASHFYRDSMPLLPWWLSEMELDIRKPRSNQFGLARSKSLKPLIDGKYRMGYLESQLELKVLERRDSKANKDLASYRQNNNGTPIDESITIDIYSDNNARDTQPYNSNYSEAMYSRDSGNLSSAMLLPPYNNDSTGPRNRSFWSKNDKGSRENLVPMVDLNLPNTNLDNSWNNNGGGGKMKKKNKKPKAELIEPKIFFANERTFIHWLHFAALLLTTALTLLNFGDKTSRIVGGVFIGLALGIAIYAQLRFQYRAWQIRHQGHLRFDDIYGPAVLCFLIVGALALNFGLRFTSTAPNGSYLGVGNSTGGNVTAQANIVSNTVSNIAATMTNTLNNVQPSATLPDASLPVTTATDTAVATDVNGNPISTDSNGNPLPTG
ncbi:VTC domain-containing protein [Umbelopsis sp. PMI_123]|nr:VTC domain-containing protein [Umbelopsis sp. PMI_123]